MPGIMIKGKTQGMPRPQEKISQYNLIIYALFLGVLCIFNMIVWMHFYFSSLPWTHGKAVASSNFRGRTTTIKSVDAHIYPRAINLQLQQASSASSSGANNSLSTAVVSAVRSFSRTPESTMSASHRRPLDILHSSPFDDSVASTFFHRGPTDFSEISTFAELRSSVRKYPFQNRSVILGLASFIDTRYLAIFVKSARRVNATTEIFLFLNKPSMSQPRIRTMLLEARVHVIEFDEAHLQPSFMRKYHSSSIRWIFYTRFLSNYEGFFGAHFDKVLVCDVRDVHFSADPFQHLDPKRVPLVRSNPLEHMKFSRNYRGTKIMQFTRDTFIDETTRVERNESSYDMHTNMQLHSKVEDVVLGQMELASSNTGMHNVFAFKEEDAPNIGGCSWNSGWIKDCFGQAVLDVISTSPIACSGVVMGKLPEMLPYFKATSDILLGLSPLSDKFPACERNGVDQGILNVLLHSGSVSGLQLHSARSFPGVVSHMQSDLYVSIDGASPPQIVNSLGDVVSIVHQYDRLGTLQQSYAQQYVDWMDVNNPHQGWDENRVCRSYHSLIQADILKGTCEFGSLRALQPDMCCDACTRKAGCTSFTFTEGVCWFKKCDLQSLNEIYVNYTMHAALHLDMLKYTAIAFDTLEPVSSLVMSAIPSNSIGPLSDAQNELLIADLLERNGRAGKAVQLEASGRETSDVHQLALDYRIFVAKFEAQNAAAKW